MKSQIQKEKAKRRLLEKEYRRIKNKIRSITLKCKEWNYPSLATLVQILLDTVIHHFEVVSTVWVGKLLFATTFFSYFWSWHKNWM
jgi:hypothetical protein